MEKNTIYGLETSVVLEYIKSSIDIILNLKFEEIEKRFIEKGRMSSTEHPRASIKSSANPESSARSNFSEMEGPPKVYEELIQGLEAEIRKHIRIEQQLKLHIESVENRVEELEKS